MATKDYTKDIYKALQKGMSKGSYSGFYLLISLVIGFISIIISVIIWIAKLSIKRSKEIEQAKVVKYEYDNVLHDFKVICETNCFTISMSIEKTNFTENGLMEQYINFYVYNKYTVELENINRLINRVLGNSLTLCKKKNFIDCIVIRNIELEEIKDRLKKSIGKEIFFRYVEEIKEL